MADDVGSLMAQARVRGLREQRELDNAAAKLAQEKARLQQEAAEQERQR